MVPVVPKLFGQWKPFVRDFLYHIPLPHYSSTFVTLLHCDIAGNLILATSEILGCPVFSCMNRMYVD